MLVKSSVAPLLLVAVSFKPVKSKLSPWLYSIVFIGDVTANESTGSFTLILKVVVLPE